MSKYLFLLILTLSVRAVCQINDSVRVIFPADTIITDTISSADTLVLTDTTALLSDSTFIIPDTIKPLYQRPLYYFSRFINKNEFYRKKLSYSADILLQTPFFFDVSHGLPGYPGSFMLFGTGPSSSVILVNGLSYNDYSALPFDLNRLQTEYIDSVEILPLPRGFLYGTQNSNSAINIIGKDFLSPAPYSRIKYYEGPYGEGFIDGIFNSIIFNRFVLFLDITNKKIDERYRNSDFGLWNGRAQLKYIFNNNINILSGYEYSSTNTGANGGIDVLNMTVDDGGFFEALYNEISVPVVYPELRFNTYSHNIFLKTIGNFGKHTFTDAGIYYRFNRIELNGNVDTLYLDNLFKNKITGASLIQNFRFSSISFEVLANFESADIIRHNGFSSERVFNEAKVTRFNLAGTASLSLLDSVIHPSLFYKLSTEKIIESKEYAGIGADFNIIIKNYRIYAGYSHFENSNTYSTQTDFPLNKIKNFQAGLSFNSHNFKTSVNYFSRKGTSLPAADTILKIDPPFLYPSSIDGVNLNFNILLSKVLLEGSIDYYREKNKDLTDIFPSSFISGGVYYKDSLFSGNLDLKTGFNISWYARRNLNLGIEYFNLYKGNTAGPDFILDFTMSGEIQNRAIIFFLWENLLDRRYFIVPFYPMPPRGIRFGVSWELFN